MVKGRKLGSLLGAREQQHLGAAMADLPGDLRPRQRRVNRHVDRARHLNCKVGDHPLVAVLRNVRHAVAAGNAQFHEHGSRLRHRAGDFVPGQPAELPVLLDGQGGQLAVGIDAAGQDFDDRFGLMNHGLLGSGRL
jgi:hypothetical protein